MNSASRPAKHGDLRFYKNYTLIMLGVFCVILLSLGAFFANRFTELVRSEIKAIEFYVDENGQMLDYLFRATIDQLEIMALNAELEHQRHGACELAHSNPPSNPPSNPTPNPEKGSTHGLFTETAQGFMLKGSIDDPWQGNIVGQGSFEGRLAAFYCDLQVALQLRTSFASLPFALNGVKDASFVSKHGFTLKAPWHSNDQAQQKTSLDNPRVIPITTDLIVGQRELGTLSIGLDIEFLNRMNDVHHFPSGLSFITTQAGEVLLDPTLQIDHEALAGTYTRASVHTPHLFAAIDLLDRIPYAQATKVGEDLFVVYNMKAAPWHLLFVVPESQVHAKVLRDVGPGMLSLFLGLAVVMLTSYLVTSRYFVRPAAKLVSHVASESNLNPQPIPDVPATWRPWFEVITKAFHESLELNNLQREIDIAARLQASLLPSTWPDDSRYRIWGKMQAAKYIGGDFYDHLHLDNDHQSLVVADVSGKGIPAGLFGMVCKTYLRSLGMYGMVSVDEIMRRVNNRLCEDNDTCMFVTALYAQYDPATGTLYMVNAGHPPQLLISASGQVRWIKPPNACPALGAIPDASYEQMLLTLEPGDQLLIFSDGVSEAMDTAYQEFGFERLAALFKDQPSQSPQETVERVFAAVTTHEAGTEQSDDITCMVLQRLA